MIVCWGWFLAGNFLVRYGKTDNLHNSGHLLIFYLHVNQEVYKNEVTMHHFGDTAAKLILPESYVTVIYSFIVVSRNKIID